MPRRSSFTSWSILLFFVISTLTPAPPSYAQELDEDMIQQKKDCEQSKSKRWDSQRNMCVTTVESKELRDAVRACGELEGEAQKACHDRLAEERTGVKGGESEGKDALLMVSILGAAASGIMLMAGKKMGSGSTCTSLYIMGATSLAGLAAEFLYKKEAKDKLKDLRDKYKEEATVGDPYAAQKRAFVYLKEEQLAISDLAKKRFHSYLAVAAGYSIAAVYAVMEASGSMGIKKCGAGSEEAAEGQGGADSASTPDASSPGADSLSAEGPANANDAALVSDGQSSMGAANGVLGPAASKGFSTPMGIAIISGIGAGVTGFLAVKANRQSKQSKEQADLIQNIIDGFDDDYGQFCPQGRDNLQDPKCYCYTADGKENSKRTNSQTCQQLWAERNRNLAVGANNYAATGAKQERKGCFFQNRQFDPDCRCKEMKNTAGQNACMKVGMPQNALGGVGQAMSMPQVMGDLNRMVQGEFDAGNVNGAQLQQRAAAAARVRDKIFDDFNKKGTLSQKLPSEKEILDTVMNRAKRIPMDPSYSGMDPLANVAAGRPEIPGLSEALKNVNVDDKSADDALESVGYKPAAGPNKKSGGNKNDDYFFDYANPTGSTSEVLDGFMEKDYNYGGNDIVQRDDVSIWEVISHRYVNTGLKRLFGDQDLAPVEDFESE